MTPNSLQSTAWLAKRLGLAYQTKDVVKSQQRKSP